MCGCEQAERGPSDFFGWKLRGDAEGTQASPVNGSLLCWTVVAFSSCGMVLYVLMKQSKVRNQRSCCNPFSSFDIDSALWQAVDCTPTVLPCIFSACLFCFCVGLVPQRPAVTFLARPFRLSHASLCSPAALTRHTRHLPTLCESAVAAPNFRSDRPMHLHQSTPDATFL